MVDGLSNTDIARNDKALPAPTKVKATESTDNTAPKQFATFLSKANYNASYEQELGTDSPPPKSAGEDAQLRWTAQQLEAMFLQELFAGMRRTVPEGGLFPNSFSMRTYQEMLDAEQAKALAQGGGVGIADVVLRQLKG